MNYHFNVALYPQEPALQALLTNIAVKNLNGQTDQYLLGKQALPHITLCQFTGHKDCADEVWAAVQDLAKQSITVQFSHIYIKAGDDHLHRGKNWVGLSVVPDNFLPDSLSYLQGQVDARLRETNVTILTDSTKYFPHLTFGRLSRSCAITISSMPAAEFWQKKYQFQLTLGRSNANGVYVERLF